MRRALTVAGLIIMISTAAAAQSRYDEIHRDVLRKFEVRRARALMGDTRLLAPEPTPGQLLYDAIHYEIDIAIRFATQQVVGSVTILLESLVDSLFVVDIDADIVLSIHGVTEVGSSALPFSHISSIISVNLSPGLALGEQIELRIDYSGYPATAAETGLFFRTYNSREVIYSLSEPWGARSWWPCKDYPDDKATFDLYFAVPSGNFAASNGTYIGESDVEHWGLPFKRYHWQENYPMPTYLASIAATEYVRLDDYWVYAVEETLDVHHYIYPELVAQATEDLNITVPMIQFFSGYFGTYPFTDDKYGVALCNIGGGMEHQTLTSYGYYFIRGDHAYDWLFAHELAHQWFGDLITCKDWTHIWLNEGFASYAEALWFEHLDGPAALKDYMGTMDNPSYWNGPVMREPDNSDPWYYFDSVVYDKGAWVLHMLRHIVGDTDFLNILRTYVADTRYRFSVAETDDLIAICEVFYGSPLDWFFDPWLNRTDRLEYSWSWNTYTQAGGEYLTVSVDQVQAGLYTMPVDFRIQTTAGQLDTIFWVTGRHEEFQLVLGDPVLDVQLDPDHWILCTRSETATSAGMIPAAAFLDQNFPNPFNPVTTIRFGLAEAGNVVMRVYDVRGALVATLAEGHYGGGSHEVTWNGTNQRGERVSSGLYFYRLQTPEGILTRKMLLLR